LAAPLAKLKDIERKQQSILSQNGGTTLDEIDNKPEAKAAEPKKEKHSSTKKEEKVIDINKKEAKKNKSKNTHDII